MSRPNVLFIIADDHRHNAIAACGDPVVQTPHLDQLIAAGTRFSRNYMMGGLSGAVCIPTRAAVHTGCNPFAAALASNDSLDASTLNPQKPLLAETFRNAGYHTFATGKWHNCRASFARSFAGGANIFFGGMSDHDKVPLHDFDPARQYRDEDRYIGDGFSTELFSAAACDFLRDYQGGDPFFLYLAFTAPHDPRTPPPQYADLYNPQEIPLPPNFVPEHPFDNGDMRLRDEVLADFPRTKSEIQHHIADYYGMISHMDAHIGKILATLQESGRAQDTLVVYTADHGLAVGQHGLLGKQNMYEHSVSVPLILRGPQVPQNSTIEALSFTYDIYPTLCQLADLKIPQTVESESLVPLLNGDKEQIRETTFSIYKDIQRMVSDGRWKLIRYYKSAKDDAGSDCLQLFDLQNDPHELNDLSTQEPDHLQRLATELKTWMQKVDDPLKSHPLLLN